MLKGLWEIGWSNLCLNLTGIGKFMSVPHVRPRKDKNLAPRALTIPCYSFESVREPVIQLLARTVSVKLLH